MDAEEPERFLHGLLCSCSTWYCLRHELARRIARGAPFCLDGQPYPQTAEDYIQNNSPEGREVFYLWECPEGWGLR